MRSSKRDAAGVFGRSRELFEQVVAGWRTPAMPRPPPHMEAEQLRTDTIRSLQKSRTRGISRTPHLLIGHWRVSSGSRMMAGRIGATHPCPQDDALRTTVDRGGPIPNLAGRSSRPCHARDPPALPTCITMHRRSPTKLPILLAIRWGGRHASFRRM